MRFRNVYNYECTHWIIMNIHNLSFSVWRRMLTWSICGIWSFIQQTSKKIHGTLLSLHIYFRIRNFHCSEEWHVFLACEDEFLKTVIVFHNYTCSYVVTSYKANDRNNNIHIKLFPGWPLVSEIHIKKLID